jgi:signal transduction histidine kinase
MSIRRSLSLPIILAIVMITLLVVLTVGWILLAVFGAAKSEDYSSFYWVSLTLGTTFIVMLLVGVVLYLVLSIKAITLTRRQSNFIDSVTHELKSPIASMKLYLQTLNRRPVSEEQKSEFYQFMLEDLERLDRLISELLEAGRLVSDRSGERVEEVELSELLCQCWETVCISYRMPTNMIEMRLKPCVVRAPRADLAIIFRNLLDNAVKYAGAEPAVWLDSYRSPQGRAIVRISDNGVGIPPRARRKVFGRFVRLGLELERKKPGTGLGLHIVWTLVRQLRGRIRIQNRVPGPGTVFEVDLPAVESPTLASG